MPTEKRLALDFYKNNTIHFFLLPALMSTRWCAACTATALRDEVGWWLDL